MVTHELTRGTFDRLNAECFDLTTRGRIEVALKIQVAREEGDLKENGGYHAAKDEQGHMEGRIRQLEYILENAMIVDEQFVYTIVYEGDSLDEAERFMIGNLEEHFDGASVISASSPLGAALIGTSEGDEVEYTAPTGPLSVRILKVETV